MTNLNNFKGFALEDVQSVNGGTCGSYSYAPSYAYAAPSYSYAAPSYSYAAPSYSYAAAPVSSNSVSVQSDTEHVSSLGTADFGALAGMFGSFFGGCDCG